MSLHFPAAAAAPAPSPGLRLGRWAALSRSSKGLLVVGAALLLLMMLVVGLTVWKARNTALDEARQHLGKLGIAIGEQTARSIQAVDIMVETVRTAIVDAHIDTPERFKAELGGLPLHEDLRNRDKTLPQADAFTVIAADGKLVNFSRQWPIPPTDLSDRDYYLYLRDHNETGAFISRPVQNRGNGQWTVYLVRRVNGPSGEFLGLVLGAIDLAYFTDFYRALTVGAGTTVTLLKSDGTALTSYPTTARIGEKLPAASPWHGMVALRKQDAFTTPGVLAPGLRVVSVNPLKDYPLVVNVSLAEWDTLATWRWSATAACVGTGCAVVCVLLLLWALMLQLERLETTKRLLQDQSAKLQSSQDDLAEKSTALETTLEHMNQGIIMVDSRHAVAVCNSRAIEMLGLPADLVRTRPLLKDLIAYRPDVLRAVDPDMAGRTTVYERRLENGRILEMEAVPLASGGIVETFTDITDRRSSEERIRYFAHHDNLTKLVNRVVFQEQLEAAIGLADRSRWRIAVLYLDLDGFKHVNDTLGHAAGDELLVEVAVRLRSSVRDSDTVARMGGDEFAIIQPFIDQPAAATGLAERLVALISQPFDIEGVQCTVGISIGIAVYPQDAGTTGELLINADKALYRAKALGRGRFEVFGEKVT